jgi:hypothetical protein
MGGGGDGGDGVGDGCLDLWGVSYSWDPLCLSLSLALSSFVPPLSCPLLLLILVINLMSEHNLQIKCSED